MFYKHNLKHLSHQYHPLCKNLRHPITNPHFNLRHPKSSNFEKGQLGHCESSDFVRPCTRLCQTLYPILPHLVPNPVTPCTRICHTLFQTMSHHVPNLITLCTQPCLGSNRSEQKAGRCPAVLRVLTKTDNFTNFASQFDVKSSYTFTQIALISVLH